MIIKTGIYLKNIFKYEYYILIALFVEIICSTVWFYPYSLPLKILILLYGLASLFLGINRYNMIIGKESILLLISCICASIPSIIYFDVYGIRGTLFFLNDLIIFFVIFKKIELEKYRKQKEILFKVAKIYVFFSFCLALASLTYLFFSGPLYYYPDGFFASIFNDLGILQKPGDSKGFIYGISNSYLVGIMSSSHTLGYLSYFSLVFTKILKDIYKKDSPIKFFLQINFIVQIITEVASGMRTMYLACAVFIVLSTFGKKVQGGKRTRVIFCLFSGICILILVIFVSFTGKRIQNISNLETREISAQKERIISEWEEYSDTSKIIKDKFDGSVFAYNFVKDNETLKYLDALSTTRIRIWISTFFELAERKFIGKPSNTVEVIIKGEKTNIDFHSAYFRALSIYGLLGMFSLFVFLKKIFLKCYKILTKRRKSDNVTFTISAALVTQFIMLLFGGGLSGSLDFQVLIFWIFSAIIYGNKTELNN